MYGAAGLWRGPLEYDLPESLIAQQPAAKRDDARLMIVARRNGTIRHAKIPAIVDELTPGDRLVLNYTRVYPARLYGRKESGGRVELLVLALEEGAVPAIARASKPILLVTQPRRALAQRRHLR